MWYWQNNKQIDKWDRIKRLEMDLYKYSQLIFDKGAKEYKGAKVVSSINGAGHPHIKKNKLKKNESRQRTYPLHKN